MGELTDRVLADFGVTPEMIEAAEEVISDPEIRDLRDHGKLDDRGLVEMVFCAGMAHESSPVPLVRAARRS